MRQALLPFIALALLAAACSGGSTKKAPPAEAPAESTPTAPPSAFPAATRTSSPTTVPPETTQPPGVRSGDTAVDAVLDALASGDRTRVLSLVAWLPIACVLEQKGLGGPPNVRTASSKARSSKPYLVPARRATTSLAPA